MGALAVVAVKPDRFGDADGVKLIGPAWRLMAPGCGVAGRRSSSSSPGRWCCCWRWRRRGRCRRAARPGHQRAAFTADAAAVEAEALQLPGPSTHTAARRCSPSQPWCSCHRPIGAWPFQRPSARGDPPGCSALRCAASDSTSRAVLGDDQLPVGQPLGLKHRHPIAARQHLRWTEASPLLSSAHQSVLLSQGIAGCCHSTQASCRPSGLRQA